MTSNHDKTRARHAKGAVQEAIGKIIGDAAIEQQGVEKQDLVKQNAGESRSNVHRAVQSDTKKTDAKKPAPPGADHSITTSDRD